MAVADGIRELDAGHWESGISALVAAWSDSRDPALGVQIRRLGDHAAAASPALEATKPKARQAEWESRFGTGRTADLGRLLESLEVGSSKDLKARLGRLRERAPDPRVTPALSRFAREIRLSSTGARPMWTAFFRLVKHTADPELGPALAELRAFAADILDNAQHPEWHEFEAYLVKQVDAATKKLATPSSADDLASLTALVDRLVSQPFAEVEDADALDVDALFAAVLTDPADLGAIAVWADALSETGDDRGTFVMLQLAAESRSLKSKEKALVKRLQKANLSTWLGSLGPYVDGKTCRFRRGLLEFAQVRAKRLTAEAMDDPAWRSVEQAHSTPEHLAHPNLVSLSRIGTHLIPDPDAVWGPLGFRYDDDGSALQWTELVEFARAGRQVRHLEISVREHDPRDIPVVERAFSGLETIFLECDLRRPPDVAAFAPWLRTARRVVIVNPGGREGERDAAWLDALPESDVHIWSYVPSLYRSWIRRDGELHLVLSESGSSGLLSAWQRGRKDKPGRYDRSLGFMKRLPEAASLTVRSRGRWHPEDLDALKRRARRFGPLVLPDAKGVR